MGEGNDGIDQGARVGTEGATASPPDGDTWANLAAVVEHMPAGVILAEAPSGRVVYANAQLGRILGQAVDPSDAAAVLRGGKTFHPDGRRVEPEEYPMARALLGEVVEGEDLLDERADGRGRVWVRASAAPVRAADGRTVAGVVILLDVDVEHRAAAQRDALLARERVAREAAEAAEARERAVLEGIADGVLVSDADGNFVLANPALLALLGYTLDEVLRLRAGGGSLMAAGREQSNAMFAALRRAGTWQGELDVRHKDGTVIPIDASVTAVALPDGPVFVGTWRDVRRRRALEEQQQAFLSSVAHDLKNPLSVLQVQLQLLRRRARPGRETDADRLAETVNVGLDRLEIVTARMTAQIEELTDVATLRMGEPLRLRLTEADVVALTREAAAVHRPTTDRPAARVDAVEPRILARIDRGRIGRVLDNLLANAMKFSPDESPVTVTVRRDPAGGSADHPPAPGAPAAVGGAGEQSWVVITVKDRGVGIPSTDLAHVFQRFRRGGNVGLTAGTGLGLAGARDIVAQHGGEMTVASREGEGTTVTVRLPLGGPPGDETTEPALGGA